MSDVNEWDERYSREQVWSGNPNESLLAEVTGLGSGRALDVGCGEGADSVWLARHGWDVTAVDLSANAIERTSALAHASGVTISGIAADILHAEFGEPFDLVIAMYPALPRTDGREVEARLLDLVAPGGHLLIVHHAEVDRQHALAHGCNPDHYIAPADVLQVARQRGSWDVLVDERRPRHVNAGAGAHHRDDYVVHLRAATSS